MFATSTKTATFLLTKFSCVVVRAGLRRDGRGVRGRLPGPRGGPRQRAAQSRAGFAETRPFPARYNGSVLRQLALEHYAALVARGSDRFAEQRLDHSVELV